MRYRRAEYPNSSTLNDVDVRMHIVLGILGYDRRH